MILSPASCPVQALIPNEVMPEWWRTRRQGERPSLISPTSSSRATAYSLIDAPPSPATSPAKYVATGREGQAFDNGNRLTVAPSGRSRSERQANQEVAR